jgi:hypothetical protein
VKNFPSFEGLRLSLRDTPLQGDKSLPDTRDFDNKKVPSAEEKPVEGTFLYNGL